MATRVDDLVHFDLSMSQATDAALRSIAAERAITVSDVLQRAVTLFTEIEKGRKAGQTVGLLDADKKPVVEFVGF